MRIAPECEHVADIERAVVGHVDAVQRGAAVGAGLDVDRAVGVDGHRADAAAGDRRVVLERQDRAARHVADIERAAIGDMHVVQRGAAAIGAVLDVERAAGMDRQRGRAAAVHRGAVIEREDRTGRGVADVDRAVVLDNDAIERRAIVAVVRPFLDGERVAEVDRQRAGAAAGDGRAVVKGQDRA